MSRVTEHTKEVWIVSPTGTCRVKFLRICRERETENQRHLITLGAQLWMGHLHQAPTNQGSRTSHKRGRKNGIARSMEGSCGIHTSGHDMLLSVWAHRSWSYMHKTCVRSSQSKLQHGWGRGLWGSIASGGATGSWWLLREEELVSFGDMSLAGCSCLCGWPHTHSTDQIH